MKKDRLSAFLDKYVAGGPTTAKAKEMLRDGSVHGHPLTDKQKRYFGWIAGGKKQKGGSLPMAQDGLTSKYDKKYPPIYVTDRNDPRIGMYTEEGNEIRYRPPAPIKLAPITVMPIRELKSIPTSYDDIQPVARPVASAPEFVNFTAAGQPMVDVRTGETTEVPTGYRIVTDEKGIRRLSEKEKNYRLNKKQKGGWLAKYQGGKEVLSVDPQTGLPVKNLEGVEITASKPIKQREDFEPWWNWLSYAGSGGKRADTYGDNAMGDVYRYFGGLPLRSNELSFSLYKPNTAKNPDAKYIAINNEQFLKDLKTYADIAFDDKKREEFNRKAFERIKKIHPEIPESDYNKVVPFKYVYDKQGKLIPDTYTFPTGMATTGDKNSSRALGNIFISKGRDKKGDYISYYDVFDTGTGKPITELGEKLGATKPFEIYDRIYLDPKTSEPVDLEKKKKGGSLPMAQDGTEALFQKYYGQVDRSDADPAGFDYYMYRNPEFETLSDADRSALIKRMKNFLQYESGPRATQAENVDTNTVFPDTPEQVDRRIRRNPELQTNKDLTPKKPFGHGSYEYEDYKSGGRLDTYQGEQSQTGFIGPEEETKSAVVRQIGVDAEGNPIQRPTTGYYLPTIDITAEKEDTYNNYMADKYRDAGLGEALFMAPLDYVFGYPQAAMTKLLSGKYQLPSEAMGIENPYGAIAMDILLDPANLVGAGVLTKDAALARLAASKKSGLLSNAWRLNPWAYQYNLPGNTMWRGIGREGMEDAIQSGVFRANQNITPEYYPGTNLKTSKSFGINPFFTPNFNTAVTYGDNFIAEVPRDAAQWRLRYSKRNPWSQVADRPIPISEGRILQKDWLRGYREVPMKELKLDNKKKGGPLDQYQGTEQSQTGLKELRDRYDQIQEQINNMIKGDPQMQQGMTPAQAKDYLMSRTIAQLTQEYPALNCPGPSCNKAASVADYLINPDIAPKPVAGGDTWRDQIYGNSAYGVTSDNLYNTIVPGSHLQQQVFKTSPDIPGSSLAWRSSHNMFIWDVKDLGDGKKRIFTVQNPGVSSNQILKEYDVDKDGRVYYTDGDLAIDKSESIRPVLIYPKNQAWSNPEVNDFIKQREDLKNQILTIDPKAFDPKQTKRWDTDYQSGIFVPNYATSAYGPYVINYKGDKNIDVSESRIPEILDQVNNPEYKKKIMSEYNITNDEYNSIVKTMMGQYMMESQGGTDWQSGFKIPENRFFANLMPKSWVWNKSLGPFQIKYSSLGEKTRKLYPSDERMALDFIYDPLKSSDVAVRFLAENIPQLRYSAKEGERENLTRENYLEKLPYLLNQQGWLKRSDEESRKRKGSILGEGTNRYVEGVKYYGDQLVDYMPISNDAFITNPPEVVEEKVIRAPEQLYNIFPSRRDGGPFNRLKRYQGTQESNVKKLGRSNENLDWFTREVTEGLYGLGKLGDYIGEGLEKITPALMTYASINPTTAPIAKIVAKEGKPWLFENVRPVMYPELLNSIAVLGSGALGFNEPPQKDKEGDYNVGEEAWAKALGIPTKQKYIIPSQYKPSVSDNPNAKYYTLRQDIIDPKKIMDEVEMLGMKEGDNMVFESLAPFIKEGFMNPEVFGEIDPLQKFKVSVARDKESGKKYISIYDKYDFEKSPLNAIITPYEFYDRIYYNDTTKGKKKQGGSLTDKQKEYFGWVFEQ